jgi:nucleoside-diphosphate-sugar epimerase
VSPVVLVTGGFGLVGAHTSAILLQRGHIVVALDLRTPKTEAAAASLAEQGHPGRLIPSWTDLRDPAAVDSVVDEHLPTAIVHLAAIVSPPCYLNPAMARAVNVDGTRNLVDAASHLPSPPFFVQASSSAVYGSRNPWLTPEPIDPETPVHPIDIYGQDKVDAENLVIASGIRHCLMRLGGIVSPELLNNRSRPYRVLQRAIPRDTRIHAVDVRDVALAFANAVDRAGDIDGEVFLIGGNSTYAFLQRDFEDEVLDALGIGPLGPHASLPGDPHDSEGWGFTDWFDTSSSQQALDFQQHDWEQTRQWLVEHLGPTPRRVAKIAPLLRMILRAQGRAQRILERRGPYADPWTFIAKEYGPHVLVDRRAPAGAGSHKAYRAGIS